MESDAQAREVVAAMYAAFGARDRPRLEALIAEDVRWDQCAGWPGGARRRGRDAVFQGVFEGNRERWRDFRAEVEEILQDGDRAVALGTYRGVHEATGAPMEAVFAHVYRVEGGRIVAFDQIADTWPLWRAAGGATDGRRPEADA